ncbi:MAG: hypothetical protein ACT4PT_12160 [Methanobacteriota archaeon]
MALSWDPFALGNVAVCLLGATLAATVYLARPDRTANRLLGLVLFFEALVNGGAAILFLSDRPATAYAAQAAIDVAFGVNAAAYLLFIGTLASPLARPVSMRPVRVLTVAAAVGLALLQIARTDEFIAGVRFGAFSGVVTIPGPWFVPVLLLPAIAVFLFGFAAAVTMWSTAPAGSAARAQGAAYAFAFGVRDVTWIVFLAPILLGGEWSATFEWLFLIGISTSLLALSYAILRYQLFEIDLKLKWTVRRGTLVAVFVAVAVAAFAVVEQWLEQYGVVAAAVAAGVMVLAIRPLERAADRLADRAMPGVVDTAEYRTVRKREVYRAAIESAIQDGVITDGERNVLATLQDQLGLAASDALALEREVLSVPGAGAGPRKGVA